MINYQLRRFFCVLTFGVLLGLFTSCGEEDIDNTGNNSGNEEEQTVIKEAFGGIVQKGPYAVGSSITITLLDESLNQTGRIYTTTVIDNAGNFDQKNIELVSNFIELKADGYYFNEVSGETSGGTLTLYALADISDINSVNVNILTHLEKPRIEYLMKEEGLSFADAKKQASTDVLGIFGIPSEAIETEKLDISKDELLLAVSVICQGYLSSGEMSELLANIGNDIKTDGVLNGTTLGTRLVNNAAFLNLNKVKENMENKYNELGKTVDLSVSQLQQYVQQFIDNSGFEQTQLITYPQEGRHGLNILADNFTTAAWTLGSSTGYSFKAILPKGADLKIIIIHSRSWWYGVPPLNWVCNTLENNGSLMRQELTLSDNTKENDMLVTFGDMDWTKESTVTIQYYENGATEPTKTKEIKVGILATED